MSRSSAASFVALECGELLLPLRGCPALHLEERGLALGIVEPEVDQSYRLAGEYKHAIEFYDLIFADSTIAKTEREDVQRRRQIAEWFLLAQTSTAAGKRDDARDYYRRLLDVRDLSPPDRERGVRAVEDLARAMAETRAAPA